MDSSYPARFISLIALLLASAPHLHAADEEIPDDETELDRIYMTPEERREAGVKHAITDWLTVSGLFEAEYFYYVFSHPQAAQQTNDDEPSETVQIALELTPLSWLKGEVIYEYDFERHKDIIDEFIIAIERDDVEFSAGKLYVPFGEYFSHFAAGPLVELGETRATAAVLSYNMDDRLDMSVYVYEGKEITGTSSEAETNYGFAIAAFPSDAGLFGVGYISDLGESEADLLDDIDGVSVDRVAGVNAYMAIFTDRYAVTGEIVRALDSFNGLDPDRDRPSAWNIELAYYSAGPLDWALRLEGSRELEDAPRLQGGISVTWRILETLSLTLDYLTGTFEQGLAADSDDVEITHINQYGGKISLLF
jgi:hypothetical protein